ncbi:MAG: hypothetical protein HY788_14045 [Deltaproteobacteria bacterium]|nr:hypothetical protein [Deltaproteobacteria bacterium]
MEDLGELLGNVRELLDQLQRQVNDIEQQVSVSEGEDRQPLLKEIADVRAKRERVLARVEDMIGGSGKVLEQLRQSIDNTAREYWAMVEKTAARKSA